MQAQAEMTASAWWGFELPPETHQKTLNLVRAVLKGEAQVDAARDAAEVVTQLVVAGFEGYYHIPTRMVPLHPTVRKTADGSIQAVQKGIELVIRQFFAKRTPDELRELARYLQAMLLEYPERETAYLVFPIDEALYDKAQVLIQRVQTEDRPRDHLDEIVATLSHMVTEGVTHYYERPASLVRLGGMTRKTVDMTMKGVSKGIRTLIDKLVRQLSGDQLRTLSYHVASLLHAPQ
ncbi:MAG: hypothetical protein D6758_06150 [Gammaproteobacteria bacterium]|nr:MAG: hypothetical protein D6758_06150 [Gammaproteobacteria bacterium]